MIAELLSSPDFYAAATLTERLAGLRGAAAVSQTQVNGELAQRRWQLWRAQPPFNDTSFFERRLAREGLKRDELLHLLGEGAPALSARFAAEPEWLAELRHAFSAPVVAAEEPLPAAAPGMVDICPGLMPLLRPARSRVLARAEELVAGRDSKPFQPDHIVEQLFAGLVQQLRHMTKRTLILELHVARLRDQLYGDTPAERFRSFQERLCRPDVLLTLLQDYPVLARQIIHCLQRWTEVTLEFLEHLSADYDALRQLFSPQANPGPLVHLAPNVGDTHRGGRTVIIVRFQSGLQVVYKPRSLATDRHFQQLLTWLNERGDHPPFRILQILDREDHGWVEFVEAHHCADEAAVRRFYQRQGAYLALLFALEATDFHNENVIAAGEQPVLVDLEGLFHPRLTGALVPGPAEDVLDHSVLRIGLLPQLAWATDQTEGVDVSGLGSSDGQLAPYAAVEWEAAGTDEMHMVRKPIPMPPQRHRPTLAGSSVNLLDHQEEIVSGFVATYRVLHKHRDELLASTGPLAAFAEDEVRVILRRTQAYSLLVYESYHPDVLHDALDRDRLFDRLWSGTNSSPSLVRAIGAERADLSQGDIPLFRTRPASRDLWTAAGERHSAFLKESGMEQVRRRFGRFGEEDLQRQVWIIRGALATKAMAAGSLPSYVLPPLQREADRERLLAAARAVGDRLEQVAVWKGQAASWTIMTQRKEHHWSLLPMDTNLYSGLSGMCLFLGYLGQLTGAERYTRLARGALAALRLQIDRSRKHQKAIGAFEGWGGIIYALAHLGRLWRDRTLLAEAEQLVELLPPLIAQDEKLDLLAGSAGCIAGLLTLQRCKPSLRNLAVARLCGERLLERAQPMTHGAAWPAHTPARGPLTGFSHGAAGIALSLLELARATGESRFHATAVEAIQYERSLFASTEGNWANLSLAGGEDPETLRKAPINYLVNWCHGAPGIGLARLRGLQHVDDPATRTEIDVALKTTLAHGFGRNHTLCHGDLGNLELLLEAGQTLPDPRWCSETGRLANSILDSIERDGWLCATPLAVETPGLMTGLAGIGYQLLRLAEPEKVPSVLTLAPPV